MKRIVDTVAKLNQVKSYGVFVLYATMTIALPAQTFTTLFSFDRNDGARPDAVLVQATNGDLYGATYDDGLHGGGTVFKITPGGALTTLYSFCAQIGCADGKLPGAGLIQAADLDLYGTTQFGGAYDTGTVFKITPDGALTTLYSFCAQSGCADGEYPHAALVQAIDENLYGTTQFGGTYGDYPNTGGTVFKITPGGALTTLYSFCAQSGCADGSQPAQGLVQATNGDFYGTTFEGGIYASGAVFKITASGALTTLYSFCALGLPCTDGDSPIAGLVQASDGNLYGTTLYGGAFSDLANSWGTIFKITPTGTLTTLYSFCSQSGCPDGANPLGLIQATDGDLYGTTSNYGDHGHGTVFKITTNGKLTTLHSFCSQTMCTDGARPGAGLLQATDGKFYGPTYGGGTAGGAGTVYSLSVGLGPFVEPQTERSRW
jgi:uncharacterized repeat protein (TIGR03803 family)